MQLTLHKLPEGFIVTSDEKIKIGNKVYPKTQNIHSGNTISTCLSFGQNCWSEHIITELTDEKGYHPSHLRKVLTQQDQIDFSALKEEEQKEIGWFDVEKIQKEKFLEFRAMITETSEKNLFEIGIREGFLKAQELLSDRRFTSDDMRKMMETAIVYGRQFEWDILNGNKRKEEHNQLFDKVIQSLSQQSWKIEVEMEINLDGKNGLDRAKLIPKFTNGKIKILKIK